MYLYPIGMIVTTSLFEWKQFKPMFFIGIQNYVRLLTADPTFITAALNTMIWVVLQSTVHVFLGAAVAFGLARKPFGWKIVRTSFMIPNVISSAALATIYLMIFNPKIGAVNLFARQVLGIEKYAKNWYFDSSSAFFTVTLTWILYAAVITMLIFSEITAIPQELYESARIDGAGGLKCDYYITLPLVRNALATSVIVASNSMLKDFVLVYLTTRGGPGRITLGLPQFLYETAMTQYNFGYANTIAVVLISVGMSLVFLITKAFNYGASDY